MKGIIYIDQYGPPEPSSAAAIQKEFDRLGVGSEAQKDYVAVGRVSGAGIYPAQSPQPRGRGFYSGPPDNLSDSPTNAPDLLDRLRYAYGRPNGDTLQYGGLAGDNALVIKQLEFTRTGVVAEAQDKVADSGHLGVENFQRSSTIAVAENNVRTGDSTLEQFAFLLEANPVPFSIKNPVDSDVFIRLGNHSVYPLASGTVSLRLADYPRSDLLVVPFYGGNGGVDVYWTNNDPFPYGERIDVVWEAFDTATPPNRIIIPYWFVTVDDTIGPRIIWRYPSDDAVGVSIVSSIVFDVVDYETGVDIDALELYVNNLLVPAEQKQYIAIPGGFRVLYTPPMPFLYGDTIPVVVKVLDLSRARNLGFFVWSFTTEGSNPPVMLNMSPAPCETNVSRIRNISFEIIDGGHGLDASTITFGIDNYQRNGVFIVPIIHRFD